MAILEKEMKKLFAVLVLLVFLTGCAKPLQNITQSAAAKNLDLSGFLLKGKIQSTASDTYTPQGQLIIGRVTYKSRRVGIPKDHKVPNTGNFRATKTKSLFGVQETIIEYDYTAQSSEKAQTTQKKMETLKTKAQEVFTKDAK